MDKILKILVVGGDMRQIYCADCLDKSYDVYTMGFDKNIFPENISLPDASETGETGFDCAVLPIVPPTEKGVVNSPLFSGEITVSDIKKLLAKDAVIFSGLNSPLLPKFFPEHKIYPYMEQEELTIRNAVSTAEGAVLTALKELPVTLNGTEVLIVGLGRIGASLALILKGFGAKITAAVRNSRGAAKAELLGINSVNSDSMGGNYGLVFNTVPTILFTRDVLENFPKDTLFIDLASKPGGFDFEVAKALGYRVLWELGVPGKTAPKSSGEAEADTVKNILERSTAYD